MRTVFVKFIILMGLFICLSGKIFSQVYVVYDDPEEITQSDSTTEAKIIIRSPIKDLQISHSAGKETGVFVGQENGRYRYELNHVFDADDLKDGFCKTNMEVTSSNASSGSIQLILHAGKCYQMLYDEKPRTLSFQHETKETEIYPSDNQAVLSFISTISDLTIQVGENILVNSGKKENVSGIDVIIKKEKDHTLYELIFNTGMEGFSNLPKINIQDSSHEKLYVPLGEHIVAKRQYRIRIYKHTFRNTNTIDILEGTVTDKKSGAPLIGVSISLSGTSEFAISDVRGNYRMENVPRGSTLQFSYRGYKTTKQLVTGNTRIDVNMRKNNSSGLTFGYGIGTTFGMSAPDPDPGPGPGTYARYRFGKYFGVEVSIASRDFDYNIDVEADYGTVSGDFPHLSAGVKYYPYKSWALSVHYGSVSVEKNASYYSENGEFRISGVKHLVGWSFLAGYDGTCIFRIMNINTGIGFSYTNYVSFAWNIGIGFNF